MGGRLLERLQHRVEGVRREHVDFVDHVHLVTPDGRRIDRGLQDLRHFIDPAIGCRVHFEVVGEAAAVDLGAAAACPAGRVGDAGFAVERLGQDAGDRRLADAAGAGEQVGVMKPPGAQSMRERAHHVILPDQGREVARTPLAGEYLVSHKFGNKGASRNPGTRGGWLWLLPSGPDQIHHSAMRGGPPA